MKYLVLLAFIAILASLAFALFFMLRGGQKNENDDKDKGKRMARALTVRIALSVILFICLLSAWKLGYIQPTGLPVSR